jgi:hypothetical protein
VNKSTWRLFPDHGDPLRTGVMQILCASRRLFARPANGPMCKASFQ